MKPARRRRAVASEDVVEAWVSVADAVSLPRLDEVGGHPRPTEVGVTYVEQEFHSLADEQEQLWPAEGEHEARSFRVRARSLDSAATATEFLLSESRKEVQHAHADHQQAVRVLTPLARREPGAKIRYWICWLVLWFGDTAGVWSAAIVNGDLPSTAFGQALAAGLAAACAGLVGVEIKDLRQAAVRRRDAESLSPEEQRFAVLLVSKPAGVGATKVMAGLSITVALLVAIGIGTLRRSIEGDAAGLTFGLLSMATALASLLLGYAATDDVADLLGRIAKRVQRAERRHLRLAAAVALRTRAEADETARSIKAEFALRGQAAAKRVESLGWRVQRRNPQVFGHGYPAGEQGGVIGRRVRRGGAA